LSPDDAYRLQSQLLTFRLRFNRQCDNALRLTVLLKSSHLISKLWYPGLPDHPTNGIAGKIFNGKGFGAMITFSFGGNTDIIKRTRRDKFISHVSEKIKLIPTLGDPHTILMPVEAVWGAKYPEPGMIRLSVGFEEYSELENTVKKALEAVEALKL
jgi:cystathionine beta-lyase/cystathionine gamma-synthase